ncbi:unnamed protein product [Prunus brigantina]
MILRRANSFFYISAFHHCRVRLQRKILKICLCCVALLSLLGIQYAHWAFVICDCGERLRRYCCHVIYGYRIRFRLWRFRCHLGTFFGWYVGLWIPEWDRALTGGIRWIQNPNRCADEYLDGIEDFIEFARRHNPGATRIRCPCRRCNNTLWETTENVEFHLVRNGMIETYSIWNLHGEQLDHASSSNATRVDNVEPIVDPNDQVMDII